MKKNLALLFSLCLTSLQPLQVSAITQSGWNISSSYIWRLQNSAGNTFTKNSDAKYIELDKKITHHKATFKVVQSLTNRYDFKVGCMLQSVTPTFELAVNSLDISMKDKFKGFVFARFMVDNRTEYSLRGQIIAPARIVFAPFTVAQTKKINDIFLQLTEGSTLKIALLQGKNFQPRIYQIPLEGFMELSDTVIHDCSRLNKLAAGKNISLLPDYLTKEPQGSAPEHFSLKTPLPGDGLTKDEPFELKIDTVDASKGEKSEKTELKLFSPGGEAASIGEDGKPIVAAPKSDDNLGQAKAMSIDENGKPITN